MTAIKAWFASNWQFMATIITMVGLFFGFKFSVQPGPPNTLPEIIIVIPTSEDSDPMFLDAPAVEGVQRVGNRARPLLRAKLAVALAKRDGIPVAEAFKKVMAVPKEQFDTAVATAAEQVPEVYGALGDGELLKKIIDFLNSPQGQALIRLLLMLVFPI